MHTENVVDYGDEADADNIARQRLFFILNEKDYKIWEIKLYKIE